MRFGRPPIRYRWLMRLATHAAPKPLSMLTTVTPLAQEFNIPRRAASPSKLAPYPTLVGTAMTGTRTSPPIYAGQSPLHPRNDDHDAGIPQALMLVQEAVQAGDADVVQSVDRVAHDVGGYGRFFRPLRVTVFSFNNA